MVLTRPTAGATGYGAPEIVREQPYGMPCDIWSAGVTLYLLLSGKQPFTGSTPDQTRQLMIKGDYDASLLQVCCSYPAPPCYEVAADVYSRCGPSSRTLLLRTLSPECSKKTLHGASQRHKR